MQKALELRTSLLSQGASFTAVIAAHLPDGTAEFTVDCTCAPDGSVTMEITEPQTIAGITASVDAEGENAEFPDTAVDFGLLADGNVAPMVLPQLLFACWTKEFIREAGQDGDILSAVYLSEYGDRELALEQFFTADAVPTSADLWFGTQNIATVNIENFRFPA